MSSLPLALALALSAAAPVRLATVSPSSRALTADGTHLYWLDENGVWRAPRGGGEPQVLASEPMANAQSLVVDDRWVYWTRFGAGSSCALRRIDKAGRGSPLTLARCPRSSTGLPVYFRALVDGGTFLAWAELWHRKLSDEKSLTDDDGQAIRLWRLDKRTGRHRSLYKAPLHGSIAVGGGLLCVRRLHLVNCLPSSGGRARTLARLRSSEAGPILADSNNLYLLEGASVLRLSLRTGEKRELASGASAVAMAQDGGFLYWAERGQSTPHTFAAPPDTPRPMPDGRLMRVSKAGGTPEVLAEAQPWPSALTVIAGQVYWINTWIPGEARTGALMRLE